MKIRKKWSSDSIAIFISFIVALLLILIFLIGVAFPSSSNTGNEEEKEYDRILSLFDRSPCWNDICPGVTTTDLVKKQISLFFNFKESNIAYSGDNQNGGMEFFFIPGSYLTRSSIKWESGIAKEIDLSVIFSGKKVDYFIILFGEPEYLLPIKNILPDTPAYWTIRLYYPEKGIEIIARTDSGSDSFQSNAVTDSILLYTPNKINERIQQEFTTGNKANYINKIIEWHGYGDLNNYQRD